MTTTIQDLRARFDEPEQRAALKGARLAFSNPGKPVEYPKPSNAGRPEATTAAFLAGQAKPVKLQKSTSSLTSSASYTAAQLSFRYPESHSAVASEPDLHPWYRVAVRRGSSHSLFPPQANDADRGKSPSGIAASLAAARHSPQRLDPPLHPAHPMIRHQQPSQISQPKVTHESDPEPEDHRPTAGTVDDVKMWLQSIQNHEAAPLVTDRKRSSRVPSIPPPITVPRTRPSIDVEAERSDDTEYFYEAQGPPPIIQSPKPVRNTSAATASIEAASRARERLVASQQQASAPTDTSKNQLPSPQHEVQMPETMSLPSRTSSSTPEHQKPSNLQLVTTNKRPLTPPPVRRARQTLAARHAARNSFANASVTTAASEYLSPLVNAPDLASSAAVHTAARSPVYAASHVSTPIDIPSRRLTPLMTGESYADAIVGASMASSRTASPAKDLRPLSTLRRRQTSPRQPFLHSKQHGHDPRAGSPSKAFRYTMRGEESSESEEERRFHKKSGKFGFRKHPHKHHEGDRKRWRDEITEKERKRYEGVWAANRGIYIVPDLNENVPPHDLESSVSNIVVRDIWSRSRLPADVLEEVWDLVDRRGVRRLNREEFVVGLWLIDQRLKGRKLPAKVSPSIWRSVVGVYGLKVPIPKF